MLELLGSLGGWFWAAAAITGGTVEVQGLTRQALQGDVAFCDCLAQMGCQVEFRGPEITVTGDVIIDASGRASRFTGDVRPPAEGGDCGAVYVTRQYRLRRGDSVGNATVVDIGPTRVVFSVSDFGIRRQEILELKAAAKREGA